MRNTFRKTGPESSLEMFEAEADGLNELREAGEIRVPEVIDVGVMNGQAYIDIEKLKELTRGNTINQATITEFVNALEIPQEAKQVLLDLTPGSYIGNAVEQARAIDS